MSSTHYFTITMHGHHHVVKHAEKRPFKAADGTSMQIQQGNYLNKGLLLCGVLRYGETLDQWKKRTNHA